MGVDPNSFIWDPSFLAKKNTLAKLLPSCVLFFSHLHESTLSPFSCGARKGGRAARVTVFLAARNATLCGRWQWPNSVAGIPSNVSNSMTTPKLPPHVFLRHVSRYHGRHNKTLIRGKNQRLWKHVSEGRSLLLELGDARPTSKLSFLARTAPLRDL